MNFRIKIVDTIIKINPLRKITKSFFKDYLYRSFNSKYDFEIQISDEELFNEAVIKGIEDVDSKSREQLLIFETNAILRRLTQELIRHNVLLMHGSAISYDNKAFIFIAPSGTGKSTHTKLWRDNLKDKAVMINDDKPFIKITEDDINVYGSPWNGKHDLGNNISSRLSGICFLTRDCTNSIEKLQANEASTYLYRQIYHPDDNELAEKTLALLDRILQRIPVYIMSVNNFLPDAFETSFNFMIDEKQIRI